LLAIGSKPLALGKGEAFFTLSLFKAIANELSFLSELGRYFK